MWTERPAVPPEVAAREEAWNRSREECLARFNSAVAAGKRRDYRQCEEIIASVKARHGEKASAIAAAELKKAIQRDAKSKK
jgi:DNA-binding GntR family transcriptional regulator